MAKKEKSKFTHYGWFNLIPVYVDMTNPDCPDIEVRHWSLEIPLDITSAIFDMFCWVVTLINPEVEPMFAIRITGEIK